MHFGKRAGKAFTLLELIVAIVIVALLAGIAVPTFLRVHDKSQDKVAETSLASVLRNASALSAFTDNQLITLDLLQKAAGETSLATSEGLQASASSFSVVEDPLPSTRYGEMSVAFSEGVLGVAMLSLSGNCVLGRVEGSSSPQTWTIVGASASCLGSFGLAGPDASPVDPDGDGEGFVAPKNLQALAGNAQVTLTWDPVESATGYRVYRDGVLLTPTVTNGYTDFSPVNGTKYRYNVEAYRLDKETLQSDPAYATPNPPPVEAVSDLSVNPLPTTSPAGSSAGQALVSWSPVAGATTYVVYLDGVQHQIISFNPANPVSTSEITLKDLVISQNYTVGVKAANVRGLGSIVTADFSVEPSEEAPDVMPAQPTSVSATPGDASALVSWKAVAGARTYRVYLDGNYYAQTSSSAYALKKLTNGKAYSVAVSAVNFAGESPLSISADFVPNEFLPEITDPTDPSSGLPSLPLSSKVTESSVLLSWSAVPGASTYDVMRDGQLLSSYHTVGFLDSNVTSGDTYTYKVVAKNADDSLAGGTRMVEVLAAAPSNLSAVGISKGAQLSWDPSNGAVGYRIYVDGQFFTQTQKNSGNIPGLVNGQAYSIAVSSVSPAGESARTSPVGVTPIAGVTIPTNPLSPPNAPSDFKGALEGKAINLSWAPVDGATIYRVYRDQAQIAQVSGGSFSDISIVSEQLYRYQVSAVNSEGESPRSSTVEVSTIGKILSGDVQVLPPLTPDNLKVNNTKDASVLSWDASQGAGAYRLYLDGQLHTQTLGTTVALKDLTKGQRYLATVEALNAGGSSPQSSPLAFTPLAEEGGIVIAVPNPPSGVSAIAQDGKFNASWNAAPSATAYQVYYQDLDQEKATLLLGGQTSATTFSLNAPAGAHFMIGVKSVNLSGSSASANVSVFSTPSAPVNLKMSTATSTSVKLAWDGAKNAVDYLVKGAPQNLAVGSPVANVADLAPNTTYSFSVSARNSGGSSGDSVSLSVTTLTATPASLRGTDGDKSVNLAWDGVEGASGYRVYRSGVFIASVTSPSFTDINLVNGELHGYSVSSVSPRGESAKSATLRIGAIDPIMKLIPSTPTGVKATTSGTQASVTWDAISNATSYNVYVNGISIQVVTDTTAQFSGSAGGSANVQVLASNNAGSSALSAVVVAHFAPAPPTNGKALYETSGVALSWSPSTGASMYRVYRSDLSEPIYQGSIASFTDASIKAGEKYSYTVTAGNSAGWSNPSAKIEAAPVPSAPTLTASITPTRVELSWDKSPLATSYRIYRDGNAIATTATLTYYDTNAVSFQAYSYHIVATNAAGMSDPSNTVISARAPLAPVISSVISSDKALTVKWNNAGFGSGYKVYLNGSLAATTDGSTSVKLENLTNGQSYDVSVSWYHINGLESPKSSIVTRVPTAPPSTPTGFKASQAPGQVILTWDAMTSSVAQPLTGFHVYRDGVRVQSLTTAGAVSFTDMPGDSVEHLYSVEAYGPSGISARSTILATEGESLIINGGFENGLTGWTTAGLITADSTWAYRSGTKSALVSSVTASPSGYSKLSQSFTVPAEGATLKFKYSATRDNSSDSNSVIIKDEFTLAQTGVDLPDRAYWITGEVDLQAQAGHPVTLTFQSYKRYSSPTFIRLDDITLAPLSKPMPAPSTPTSLGAAVVDGGLDMSWNQVTTGGALTGYNIYVDGVFNKSVPAIGGTKGRAEVRGLLNAKAVKVSISAYGIGGESAQTSPLQYTPYAPPAPPLNFKAVSGSGFVSLTWDAVTPTAEAPLSGYRIYRNGILLATQVINYVQPNYSSFVDFTTIPGTTYDYHIGTYGSGGNSALSSTLTATPGPEDNVINGGFENGLTGWTTAGRVRTNTTLVDRSGTFNAALGKDASGINGSPSSISQTFTVPSDGGNLEFIYASQNGTSSHTNRLLIEDKVTGSKVTVSLDSVTTSAVKVPLGDNAGHLVTVTFTYQSPYAGQRLLDVDNVRITN